MRHTFVPGTCLIISLVLAVSHFAPAQNKELTADQSIPIPKVEFDAQGELKMSASPNSSPNDFDFLVGKWKMHNRHLDKRLANCRTWTEFDSSDVNTKILNDAATWILTRPRSFPEWAANFSKVSPCDYSTRRHDFGVSTGSRATRERSILPSSVRSTQTAWAIFSAKTRSMANRSSSSSAGMRGTKTAPSGVRPFHQITARHGNGISLTSRNGPRNNR